MVTDGRLTEALPPSTLDESIVATIERAVRDADPWAFPVPPRIVRRAIRHEVDLPGLTARVPHRKSFVIPGARARHIVMNDELGIDLTTPLPETVILLARPEEPELEEMTERDLREHFRRLHFHARVHVALSARELRGLLNASAVESRIEQIGNTVFEEIRAVLTQEAFLLPSAGNASVYAEFVAVFLELRYFAPDLLPIYFPSMDDVERVEAIVIQDVDADRILRMTADLSTGASLHAVEWDANTPGLDEAPKSRQHRSRRALGRLFRDASNAARKGNDVRAAILHTRIADEADRPIAEKAGQLAAADVGRLAGRLQAALGIEPEVVGVWRELLSALLTKSAYGFWNPDARLLYDLQKVCIDFERVTYVIDLGAWLRSFGRLAIKRPLPAQREVLMSKHLRVAMSRLAKVQLPASQREQFAVLLRSASSTAERSLRNRLRPTIEETILEVGFRPKNVPERISFRKIVEQLLDAVVARGFFGMGDLRDAIAGNDLKLDDVADPFELITGDRLLRADRRLGDVLDGVYLRGAFYIRWLQRLSSCAFGTRPGRFFTMYAAIPFGGAFVLLAGLDHLIHAVEPFVHGPVPAATETPAAAPQAGQEGIKLASPYVVLVVGLLLMMLIHHAQFRGAVWRGVRAVGRGLRSLLFDLPQWLARVTLINRFLYSAPVIFFRKRLLMSLLLTICFIWALPVLGLYERPTASVAVLMFVILAAVLNSRAGRDIEELAAERLQLAWHRIRVRVFVALFDLVMDSFKRVLEGLERVLYEVDEWLRFKSGETGLMLAVKAALGFVWSIVRFFLRFVVTVLFEPQVNPIKHFPVVTVSHKVILPMGIPLSESLVGVFGTVWANTIAATTVFLLPGVFGFLVWELRGNWRLYAVNRHRHLRPAAVGHHGESLLRLMKPGLHSGTVPKLFARLRRGARRMNAARRLRDLTGYYAKLHHVEMDVRRFCEREFLRFLTESRAFRGVAVQLGEIEIGTNSLRIDVQAPELHEDALCIAFEQQSGRLIAGIRQPGWLHKLTPDQAAVLAGLLVGWYRVCGIDLVREQIVAQLGAMEPKYQLTDAGLVLSPTEDPHRQIVYNLDKGPTVMPRETGESAGNRRPVNADQLIFVRTKTSWTDWVSAWSTEEFHGTFPDLPPLRPVAVALPSAVSS